MGRARLGGVIATPPQLVAAVSTTLSVHTLPPPLPPLTRSASLRCPLFPPFSCLVTLETPLSLCPRPRLLLLAAPSCPPLSTKMAVRGGGEGAHIAGGHAQVQVRRGGLYSVERVMLVLHSRLLTGKGRWLGCWLGALARADG